MNLATLIEAKEQLGAVEYGRQLQQFYKALPDADRNKIARLLMRMKQIDGLRAMTIPDALDLLAKVGVVLESSA